MSREDDTSPLASSHNRFEVVQVNALTPQDMFHNASAVQGTPSYIIQAPAGQTYIIQQPAGSLVRQTHTGELTAGSDGIDSNQHDQVIPSVTVYVNGHLPLSHEKSKISFCLVVIDIAKCQ